MIPRILDKGLQNIATYWSQPPSNATVAAATALTILASLSLLFLARGTYLIWKKVRQIREPDKTDAAAAGQFAHIHQTDQNREDPTDYDHPPNAHKDSENPGQGTDWTSPILSDGERDLEESPAPLPRDESLHDSHTGFGNQPIHENDPIIHSPPQAPIDVNPKLSSQAVASADESSSLPPPREALSSVPADSGSSERLPDEWLSVESIRIAKKQLETGGTKWIELGPKGVFTISFDQQSSSFSLSRAYRAEPKLEMFLDPNDRISRWTFNNNNLEQPLSTDEIEMHEAMKACLQKLYESSFQYVNQYHNTYVKMTVFTKVIKLFPEFHLTKLADMIAEKWSQCRVRLMVAFCSEQALNVSETEDEGGPSREFVDDLVKALLSNPKLSFRSINNETVVLPKAHLKSEPQSPTPLLNQEEQGLYEALGTLMMYCHHCGFDENESRYLLTGYRFNPAVFSAILALTANDIDTRFENLNVNVKLRMSQALVEAFNQTGMGLDHLTQWINLALKPYLSDYDVEVAVQYLENADCLPEQFTIQVDGESEPDYDKINLHQAEFLNLFRNAVFLYEGSHGVLGEYLSSLHALARGMKKVCRRIGFEENYYWDQKVRQKNYIELSQSIQGTFDRKALANLLVVGESWITGADEADRQEKLR
jgi:hypothetical protein